MKHVSLAIAFLVVLTAGAMSQPKSHTFRLGEKDFLLDGKPFQIMSGEMHFARIPQEYWRDRLKMAKAMGLNTIATYVFWNYHEPEKGKYLFTGNADVARFVQIAREEGLWVIIRPSAYACAEWEFGGYPWWLLTEKDLKVRSKDPRFLEMTRKYFRELGHQLAPLQVTKGGNIIMVQLENEYGSYDQDKEYLALNRDIIRDSGFDVELYTCDGPSQMPRGYLPGILPAVNGLDNVTEVKELVDRYHANRGPYFIAEWYPGWFDTWGVEHHIEPAEEYLKPLEDLLSSGFSINMYMVHGGTTRGFMNGANADSSSPYAPQTSSYDYDAPIDEGGNATPKFEAFRGIIRLHLPPGVVLPAVPPRKKTIAVPRFALNESVDMFANLPQPGVSERVLTFEDLHQGYGYLLYRTALQGPQKGTLFIEHLRDYALVFLNGMRVAVLDRRLGHESCEVDLPAGTSTLDIIVENLGRINYGPFLNDNRKGITERVTLNQKELAGWKMYAFPFNDIASLKFAPSAHATGPVARRGFFRLGDTADTYLDMRDWGKGCVWVNGHNVGRYWNIGPQQTLYIPAPWLRRGENEIVIFELLQERQQDVQMIGSPILDDVGNPSVIVSGRYDKQRGVCLVDLATRGSGVEIRYTLDGSDPGADALRFTSEFPVGRPAEVAARAFRKGSPSEVIVRAVIHPSLSTGKQVTFTYPFNPRHAAGGKDALVDGFKGGPNVGDGFWQGFEGNDCDVVIDLGESRPITRLSSGYLQATRSWVFSPTMVEYSVSDDGLNFVPAGKFEPPAAKRHEEVKVVEYATAVPHMKGRYIKVLAKNLGVCPDWHPGRGGKAWIFVDEITVE